MIVSEVVSIKDGSNLREISILGGLLVLSGGIRSGMLSTNFNSVELFFKAVVESFVINFSFSDGSRLGVMVNGVTRLVVVVGDGSSLVVVVSGGSSLVVVGDRSSLVVMVSDRSSLVVVVSDGSRRVVHFPLDVFSLDWFSPAKAHASISVVKLFLELFDLLQCSFLMSIIFSFFLRCRCFVSHRSTIGRTVSAISRAGTTIRMARSRFFCWGRATIRIRSASAVLRSTIRLCWARVTISRTRASATICWTRTTVGILRSLSRSLLSGSWFSIGITWVAVRSQLDLSRGTDRLGKFGKIWATVRKRTFSNTFASVNEVVTATIGETIRTIAITTRLSVAIAATGSIAATTSAKGAARATDRSIISISRATNATKRSIQTRAASTIAVARSAEFATIATAVGAEASSWGASDFTETNVSVLERAEATESTTVA